MAFATTCSGARPIGLEACAVLFQAAAVAASAAIEPQPDLPRHVVVPHLLHHEHVFFGVAAVQAAAFGATGLAELETFAVQLETAALLALAPHAARVRSRSG